MTVHPRLVRSVPFWTLIVLSAAAIGAGAYVLLDKLGTMERTILDGTATGVEVYVGQVWAVFGGILVGAGVLGLALALAVAAARTLVRTAPAATVAEEHVDHAEPVVLPAAAVAAPTETAGPTETAAPTETVTAVPADEHAVAATETSTTDTTQR